MAIKINRDGLKTDSSLDSAREPSSAGFISSARKFVAKDQVENHVSGESLSNAEHIIDQATNLKMLSTVTSKVASQARDALANARRQLSDVKGQPLSDSRQPISSFTENDVQIVQRVLAKSALESFGSQSPTLKRKLEGGTLSLLGNSARTFLPVKEKSDIDSLAVNSSVPVIDNVSVDIDKKKGVLDAFFSTLTFSLRLSDVSSNKVRAVRIFRSVISNPSSMRTSGRISLQGIERIRADVARFRIKNQDSLSEIERKLRENGVDNAATALIPIDPLLNVRVSANSRSEVSPPPQSVATKNSGDTRSDADLSPYLNPSSLGHIDRSVANDLNSLRNLQTQRPSLVNLSLSTTNAGQGSFSSSRVKAEQLRSLSDLKGSDLSIVINENNSQEFKEIAFLSPDKLRGKIVGDFIEYSYEDASIVFGCAYRYYIVSVDENMNESVRSRIVEITVDGMRIPPFPKQVSGFVVNGFIALSISVDDWLVEKFEVLRRDLDGSQTSRIEINVVSDAAGFSTGVESREKQSNGFMQVGECVNIGGAGSTFYDRFVKSGHRYAYRVYSVDIFGNKSEAPKEIEIFVPDSKNKLVNLRKPNILAEVDSKTNKCRLTLRCDDPRVNSLFLSRRDLTIHQLAFVPPGQVSLLKLGNPSHPRLGNKTFDDVHVSDRSLSLSWPGLFENTQEDIVFIDFTARIDHTYQYQLFGTDRFGNRTPTEISPRVFNAYRSMLSTPLNLSSSLARDVAGNVIGVKIGWQSGDVDISSEDRLGNRTALSESIVRTLFQVERRRADDDVWLDFPMTEDLSILDLIESSGSVAQSYRPPFLKLNETYLYRVQAFKSGGFISNFTLPISVKTSVPVMPPVNFTVRPGDPKVRPFFVSLSWNDDAASGPIDKWEIQRAVVNNFAAARLNVKNPADFKHLEFKNFRHVFSDSSRFNSRTSDEKKSSDQNSQHRYIDTQISFGNSYFYRIRSIGIDASSHSEWAYRGVKVTDDVLEKKQLSTISDAQRLFLSEEFVPLVLHTDDAASQTSYSIVPTFSSPESLFQKSVKN